MASKPKKMEKAEVEEEDVAADGGEVAQPKRKLPLKLIIMAAAGLLVVGGGGAAAYLFLLSGGTKNAAATSAPTKPPAYVDVPEVLVNLSNVGSDRTQYLKVKIVLEIPDAALAPQIEQTMPRVMDTFQTYLRELRPTDLDGSAGLYRLKEELTRRVNTAIAPSRITAVLFKEIVVQ
ncbi:MAG TPA: flagellar basal body-associated FliL family protein [Xanthobacteraceae bacterium]|nr:flagellar basal body-associated FliL family protein [Xanthobacteraceae bacterium]